MVTLPVVRSSKRAKTEETSEDWIIPEITEASIIPHDCKPPTCKTPYVNIEKEGVYLLEDSPTLKL